MRGATQREQRARPLHGFAGQPAPANSRFGRNLLRVVDTHHSCAQPGPTRLMNEGGVWCIRMPLSAESQIEDGASCTARCGSSGARRCDGPMRPDPALPQKTTTTCARTSAPHPWAALHPRVQHLGVVPTGGQPAMVVHDVHRLAARRRRAVDGAAQRRGVAVKAREDLSYAPTDAPHPDTRQGRPHGADADNPSDPASMVCRWGASRWLRCRT